MTDKQIIINKMEKPKRYCEGIDCAWCNEKEPCIYKIANELEEKLLRKEQAEQKLERITNILFTGQCSNCEGYSPNCSNKELCDFKHNIKNIIDEVE